MKRMVLVLAFIVLAGCTNGSSDRPHRPKAGASESASAGVAFDGWTLDISIRPTRIGPLQLMVEPAQEAPTNEAEPWIKHDVVFRNMGTRALRFDDTRTSKFLQLKGKARLITADEGCGYGVNSPGAPVKAGACQDYLDAMRVKPRRTEKREVTLSKELKGMDDLIEGTYVFRKEIRFRVGSEGRAYETEIAIRYVVKRDNLS